METVGTIAVSYTHLYIYQGRSSENNINSNKNKKILKWKEVQNNNEL